MHVGCFIIIYTKSDFAYMLYSSGAKLKLILHKFFNILHPPFQIYCFSDYLPIKTMGENKNQCGLNYFLLLYYCL